MKVSSVGPGLRAARRGIAWAIVAVVLAGQGSFGNEAPATRGESTVGQAGMRVAVQPESGDLVPAAGEIGPFDEPAGEPVFQRRPDGGLYVDLRGRCLNYAVVQRTPDGRFVHTCTMDAANARTLAASPAETTRPETDARGWEVR